MTGSFPGRSPWMPNVFLVTTIFSDDLLRKLYNIDIWRKMGQCLSQDHQTPSIRFRFNHIFRLNTFSTVISIRVNLLLNFTDLSHHARQTAHSLLLDRGSSAGRAGR